MLLQNQWVNEEIKKEIKNYLKTNDNEDTTTPNPWDATKGVLRGKFIAVQTFLRKEEKSQFANFRYFCSSFSNSFRWWVKLSN